MRYLGLATDYDATLATEGAVDPKTIESLRRLAATGRKLILVTGRQLDDVTSVFPEVTIFDRVVAENGALVYRPGDQQPRALAEAPPSQFVEELRRRGVQPLFIGRVVVATIEPNDTTVIDVIRKMGLDLQVILNKGSVMVLPASVDKATGLAAALQGLALAPDNVVGIGDAENDLAFLAMCGCGFAVANALDVVKERADRVTKMPDGAGVREVIEWLISEDLQREVAQ